jgi:hypothetical protein
MDGRRAEYVELREGKPVLRRKRLVGWDQMVARRWFTAAQISQGERYRSLCRRLDTSGADWWRERVDGGGDAGAAHIRQSEVRRAWEDMRQQVADAFPDALTRGRVLHALSAALDRELTIRDCNAALGYAGRSGSTVLMDMLRLGLQAWVDAST